MKPNTHRNLALVSSLVVYAGHRTQHLWAEFHGQGTAQLKAASSVWLSSVDTFFSEDQIHLIQNGALKKRNRNSCTNRKHTIRRWE